MLPQPERIYLSLFFKESIIKEPMIVANLCVHFIGYIDGSFEYAFLSMAGLNHYYGHKNMQTGVQPITRLIYRVSGLCLFSQA